MTKTSKMGDIFSLKGKVINVTHKVSKIMMKQRRENE
jgi:hypothetical protein